jgi:tetratricopeptide (TPR) repeat protein
LAHPIHAIQVPPTVQALLAARIDRLAPEDKRLVQTASVIGRDVPFAVLRAIAELPDEALHRGLNRLRAAEFIYETKLFPEVEYTFKHALTHEVAYGGLLHEHRRALHARIVEALERLYPDRLAEHIERLADHALRGEVWDRAVGYLREAVSRQAARSAYDEALTSFEAALRALAHRPDSREARAQAIDLRLDSRIVLAPLGQYDRILEYMREAETMARELGDRRRLGLVLADMGARLRNVGNHRLALDASRQALDIATELGLVGLHIEAKYRLAQAHFALGEFNEAIAIFRQTIEALAEESPRVAQLPSDASQARPPRFFAAWPRLWIGLSLGHLGHFTEALSRAEEALHIAESAGHPHTLIEAYAALGAIHLERGDLEMARRAFERGIALLPPQGTPDANLLSGLGYTHALSGRLSEALPLLEESALSETSISAMGSGLSARTTRLAMTYLLAGRIDDAMRRAQSAVELSTKHEERANRALALKVCADITVRNETSGAIGGAEHYAPSLALANELGMRPLVAHCRAALGILGRRQGQRSASDEHFATAAGMYGEMGMAHWLRQVEIERQRP